MPTYRVSYRTGAKKHVGEVQTIVVRAPHAGDACVMGGVNLGLVDDETARVVDIQWIEEQASTQRSK